MQGDLALFLKESRHLFSICPGCGEIHRLSDLKLARRGRYRSDWLDRLRTREDRLQAMQHDLSDKERTLKDRARGRAQREVMPKLLERAVPVLARRGIDPRDVRILVDPIDFVVFDGMNSSDGLSSVRFVSVGPPSATLRSIEEAIRTKAVGWQTLRVGDEGTVTPQPVRGRGGLPGEQKQLRGQR